MAPALPMVLVEKEFVAYKSIPVYLRYNPDWAPLVDHYIDVPCWLPHCFAKYKYKYQIEQIVGERVKTGTTQFLIRYKDRDTSKVYLTWASVLMLGGCENRIHEFRSYLRLDSPVSARRLLNV
ncbi:hypothetical protein BT96DRAFT_943375 [Gymnopus androsaceus JB14]|uniref:Chromo domain-containing protein n=1 Tax=Gymnopus androsaceus JB14 TaxID=1447944 RepID=A0A6A4HA99_9AGAR|nr:hypothetical protein BT96DRAFT_943375 [Gymnopus androsaceus JB14]